MAIACLRGRLSSYALCCAGPWVCVPCGGRLGHPGVNLSSSPASVILKPTTSLSLHPDKLCPSARKARRRQPLQSFATSSLFLP
jgi:hypothetical protein